MNDNNFQFSQVNSAEAMRQLEALDKNKSNSGRIPTSTLKDTKRIVCPHCINSAILDCKFPGELKRADISPIFKKLDSTSKTNFRPIRVLPSTSKEYERILKDQTSHYFKINSGMYFVVSGRDIALSMP